MNSSNEIAQYDPNDSEDAKNTQRIIRRTRVLSKLRQATWEATQYLTLDETLQYVTDVLREVESDEP